MTTPNVTNKTERHDALTPKAKKEFDKYWAWKTPTFYSLLAVFIFLFVSVSYFPQYSIYVFFPFMVLVFSNIMMTWHYLRLNYFLNHHK